MAERSATMTSLESAQDLKKAGAVQMGSGATGILSGFASLQASTIQARQLKMQGIFLGLQRNAEKLRAREQAVFLRKKFLSNIASANASFAGRGVSTSSGIATATTTKGLRNLGLDIKQAELNSEGARIQLNLQSTQLKLAEKNIRTAGIAKFGKTFSQGMAGLLTGYKAYKAGAKQESLLKEGGSSGS